MPTLTFTENALIWVTAGALVFSGTPAAAIAFLTVAPSFVVAMRTGNLGGIITWYLDGNPVAVVDTHSDEPGIVEVTLVGNPDLDEHQLYAVKDDDPDTVAEIVRKELTQNEVQPPGTRYNSDCDCVQATTDGGTTWVDAPGLDPRSQPGYLMPARTSSDPRCDAAANMVNAIRGFLEGLDDGLTNFAIATAIIAAFGLLVPTLGLILALIIAVADAIFAGEISAWKAAMTDAVYDQLLCIFFRDASSDGTLTQTQFDTIYGDVGAQLPTTAGQFTQLVLSIIGQVGLNNAGTQGTETADCSLCPPPCFSWPDLITASHVFEGDNHSHTSIGLTCFGGADQMNFATLYNTNGVAINFEHIEIDLSDVAGGGSDWYLYGLTSNNMTSPSGQTLIDSGTTSGSDETLTIAVNATFYGFQTIFSTSPCASRDARIGLSGAFRVYSDHLADAGLTANC